MAALDGNWNALHGVPAARRDEMGRTNRGAVVGAFRGSRRLTWASRELILRLNGDPNVKDVLAEIAWKALDKLQIGVAFMGLCEYGNAIWEIHSGRSLLRILRKKFSDAAEVHAFTGTCPTLALHVQWDLPAGLKDTEEVEKLSKKHGIRAGSINPNIFQNQEYKYGSLGNPDSGPSGAWPSITFWSAWPSPKRSIRATCLPGLRMAQTIRGPRTFANDCDFSRKV